MITTIMHPSYGQDLYVNGSKIDLKYNQTTIIKFDLGEQLKFNLHQSVGSYKFKVLPLSHSNTNGHVTVACDKEVKLGRKVSIKKKIRQQRQEDRVMLPNHENICDNDFIIETKDTDCINRILITLITKPLDDSFIYKIELRPNQRCD
jgi:hypothetical protein